MSNKLQNLLENKIQEKTQNEPILTPSITDYQPGERDKFFAHLNKMREFIWFPHEIVLTDDESHVKFKLTAAERNWIKTILSFFAFSDSIVADNASCNFETEVQPMFVKACYRFMEMMEDIHAETYQDLLLALFPGEQEQMRANVLSSPSIKLKVQWMAKWMSAEAPFAQRIVAFLCVEGIFFSSSFASIFWFKNRGLLPGVGQSNELISRDENMHQELAILIYESLINKVDVSIVHGIFKEAVAIEEKFIAEALPAPILDMNADRLATYTKFIADRLLGFLGCPKIYNVKNSCSYMDNLGIESKVNFFENVSSSYKPFMMVNKLKKLEEY